MSLRNRLTLLFTALVSALLAFFCIVLYLVADQHRERQFQARLQSEAATAGHLLVGQEPNGPALYKLMDRNQLTVLPREEIIIYNEQNQLVYESGEDYLTVTPATIQRVRRQQTVFWREDTREIAAMLFSQAGRPFVILASAEDTYGHRTVQDLAWMLSVGWVLMAGLMLLAGRFFVGRTLQPINRINRRIDEITASNLSMRLPEGNRTDELTRLAQRFNRMLNRLEDAFRVQRSFVAFASHELRTPLTAITGQLEVSLLADDEPDELRATLCSVLDDVRGLNRMANGLLALASASMDASGVPMGPIALNTLLERVGNELQRAQPDYTIHLTIRPLAGSDTGWLLRGNESLLQTALYNLLENGGKFSANHTVTVTLVREPGAVRLRVHNTGPAIAADQLTLVFIPFQRGRNASGKPGHGIGLPLTERIIRLHGGQIRVESSAEAGTTFTITLPDQGN